MGIDILTLALAKKYGEKINVDAEMKDYMSVVKPAIKQAIITKGGNIKETDSFGDYATRISEIPNNVYPAETLPMQTNLSAFGLYDSVGIKLNWSNVDASGYLIIRKENEAPSTSADGTIVYNDEYASEGYIDTDVQKGKVYYYRIFCRNDKNQYQSTEDGAIAVVDYKDRIDQCLLGDLPLGTKIRFGEYDGVTLTWEIIDTYDKKNGFVTACLADITSNLKVCFDAKEPNNPNSSRASNGNNRWSYSAIRQFLNSDQNAGKWWTKQHEYDAQPSYSGSRAGFLKDFTTYEKNAILNKINKCILSKEDGGGTETTYDKVWLPSCYAMGCEIQQPLEDDHIYEKFVDNASRKFPSDYWTRSIFSTSSTSGGYIIMNNGINAVVSSTTASYAARAFCQLPISTYMTHSNSAEAYIFADDSERNDSVS